MSSDDTIAPSLRLVPISDSAVELTETQRSMLEALDIVRAEVLEGRVRALMTITSQKDKDGIPTGWGRTWDNEPQVSHLELVGMCHTILVELTTSGVTQPD